LCREVRNSALAPQSVRGLLREAWLPLAWLVPGSRREQQVAHWPVPPEEVRQLSPQLQMSRALSLTLWE
jgi:hypothetical protein